MEKCNNLYLLNMLQISLLFGTIYFLVKTAPKVRDLGEDYQNFMSYFLLTDQYFNIPIDSLFI